MSDKSFKIRNYNPNIVIKGLGYEEPNINIKKIKQLNSQLEKLEIEKKSLWLKRDDYNNTVREQQRRVRELREERDLLNGQVAAISKERKEAEKLKEELIAKKRAKGELIDQSNDHDEKKRLYKEMVSMREELDRVFDRARELREQFNDLRGRSTEAHQNMLVYKNLERQSSREANDYHKKGKKIGNQIYKIKGEIYQLRRGERRK